MSGTPSPCPLSCPACGNPPVLQPRHRETFPRTVRQQASYSCRQAGHFISSPAYEAPTTVALTDAGLEAGARRNWDAMIAEMGLRLVVGDAA